MDFEAIYKLQETEATNDATQTATAEATTQTDNAEASALTPEIKAAEEAMDIAMNQLNVIIKNFKNDQSIQQIMDLYDGKNLKESIDSNMNHLTEAKKGSFKFYYKQLVNSTGNIQKKARIAILITISVIIIAGVAGSTALISKLIKGKKQIDAVDSEKAIDKTVVTNDTLAGTQNTNTIEATKASLKGPDANVIAAVENGHFGVAPERAQNLINAGYDPIAVQNAVNADIASHPEKKATAPAAVEPAPTEEQVNVAVANQTETVETPITAPGVANAPTVATAPASATNTVETTTQPVANDVTSDNGYAYWKANNPNIVQSVTSQARAAGKDPEVVLQDVYQNGNKKDALRTIEKKYGFADISGNTTDLRMVNTINKAATLNAVNKNPDFQAYLQYLKQSDPAKYGNVNSAEQLSTLVNGFNNGLLDKGRAKPGVTTQIQNGYKVLHNALLK